MADWTCPGCMVVARRLVIAAFVLLLLTALATPTSGKGELVTINLLWAEDHGCTPDDITPADLKVTVKLGSDTLIEAYAPQQDRPEFALAVQAPRPTGSERLTVRIEEGEPAGFLLLGTDFVACDASPSEEANVHGLNWDGSKLTVEARGDGDDATSFRMQLGSDPPATPVARVSAVTAKGATISWDADGTGQATRHHVAGSHYGGRLRSAGADAGSVTFTDLCDGMPYSMRVIREAGDWRISSQDFTFETNNIAPAPPRIVKADSFGKSVQLEWEEATSHDIDHYDIHAGNGTAFAPTSANKVGTGHGSPTMDVRGSANVDGGETHVKVVAVDKGGLMATSPAFRIDDPSTEPKLRGFADCGAAAGRADTPTATSTSMPTETSNSEPSSQPPSKGSPAAAAASASVLFLVALLRRRQH